MFSKKTGDQEVALISLIGSAWQSTHNYAASNSVGMAVLALKDRYFGAEPTEEFIEECYQDCLNDLNAIQDESRKACIEFIIQKSKEPNDQYDRVCLYLPSQAQTESKPEFLEYADIDFILPLREVLPLVWMALHDNRKFIRHPKETEAQALKFREQIFFNALEELRMDPVCHHGCRNELVFTLNKSYQGIDLIEDYRATVLAMMKDNVTSLFWQKFDEPTTPAQTKKALTSAMFKWMGNNDPSAVLKIVDPENNIRNSIIAFFIKHGCNPANMKLDEKIDASLKSLNFTCDPKLHPNIARIAKILNLLEDDGQDIRNVAVVTMQKWLMETCELYNKSHEMIIQNFYAIYSVHKKFLQYKVLLEITGRLQESYAGLMEIAQQYFAEIQKTFFPTIHGGTWWQIQSLNQVIEECRRATLFEEISNFFARFFLAIDNRNSKEKKSIYSHLLDNNFQTKVILKDEEINTFLQLDAEIEDEVPRDITPYQINRIFLHAIIKPTAEWSNIFKAAFQLVLGFVKNKFNQNNSALAEPLLNTSYPPTLMAQLKYLDKLSRNEEVPTQNHLLILPLQVQNLFQWLTVVSFLNEKQFEMYYQLQAPKINQLLKLFGVLRLPIATVIDAIPPSGRSTFLTGDLKAKAIEIIIDKYDLASLIAKIPKDGFLTFATDPDWQKHARKICEEDIKLTNRDYPLPNLFSFYFDMLGIEFVKKLMGKRLSSFLQDLIDEEKILALKKFSNKYILECIGSNPLGILSIFLPENRLACMRDIFGMEFVINNIKDAATLSLVLSGMNKEMKILFLTKTLSLDLVKQLMPDGKSIVTALKGRDWEAEANYPQENIFSFYTEILGIEYIKNVIKDSANLKILFMLLPAKDQIPFLDELGGYDFLISLIAKKIELPDILRAIPSESVIPFITNKLGINVFKEMMDKKPLMYLSRIPQEKIMDFIFEHLTIAYIKDLLEKGKLPLDKSTLSLLPEQDRFTFLVDDLGINFIKSLCKGPNLSDYHFLLGLPNTNALTAFLNLCFENPENDIVNITQLVNIFSSLPYDERINFLMQEKWLNLIKKFVKTGPDLVCILSCFPSDSAPEGNSTYAFILQQLGIDIKNLIKTEDDITKTAKASIPIHNGYFIKDLLGNFTENSTQVVALLKASSDRYNLEYIIVEIVTIPKIKKFFDEDATLMSKLCDLGFVSPSINPFTLFGLLGEEYVNDKIKKDPGFLFIYLKKNLFNLDREIIAYFTQLFANENLQNRDVDYIASAFCAVPLRLWGKCAEALKVDIKSIIHTMSDLAIFYNKLDGDDFWIFNGYSFHTSFEDCNAAILKIVPERRLFFLRSFITSIQDLYQTEEQLMNFIKNFPDEHKLLSVTHILKMDHFHSVIYAGESFISFLDIIGEENKLDFIIDYPPAQLRAFSKEEIAAIVKDFNADEKEKIYAHLKTGEFITKAELMKIWKPPTNVSWFASFTSGSIPPAYTQAMAANSDRERYTILHAYLHDYASHYAPFARALINYFDRDFFEELPAQDWGSRPTDIPSRERIETPVRRPCF